MNKNSIEKKENTPKKEDSLTKNTKSISDHYDVSIKSNMIMEQNRRERINSFKS